MTPAVKRKSTKSKEKSAEKSPKSKEEMSSEVTGSASGERVFLNPQRKRLEQLHERRRQLDEVNERKPRNEKDKNAKHANKEITAGKGMLAKASFEKVGEDSVEHTAEDMEEEALHGVKNENLRALMIEKMKLERAYRLTKENENKLKALLETANKWFDKYDEIIDGIEEQMDAYDASRKMVTLKIVEDMKPLCEKWNKYNDKLKVMKDVGHKGFYWFSEKVLLKNVAHYGISFIRRILFTVAYCRDCFQKRALKTTPSESPENSAICDLSPSLKFD